MLITLQHLFCFIIDYVIYFKQILCGKEETFDEIGDLFETWYQRMITQLTFVHPTISAASLAEEADHFMVSFQGHEDMTILDSILLAILQRDTRKVCVSRVHFQVTKPTFHVLFVCFFIIFMCR